MQGVTMTIYAVHIIKWYTFVAVVNGSKNNQYDISKDGRSQK